MPTATSAKNFKGLSPMNVRTKLEVPEIIGGNEKIAKSLDMPTLPFLTNN